MAGGRGRESAFSGAEVCLGMVAWGFRVGTYKVQDWKLSFDSMGTSSEAFFLSLARRQTRCSVFTKYAWRRLAHRECIYIYMHVYIYIYDIYIYIYILYGERERKTEREREREREHRTFSRLAISYCGSGIRNRFPHLKLCGAALKPRDRDIMKSYGG